MSLAGKTDHCFASIARLHFDCFLLRLEFSVLAVQSQSLSIHSVGLLAAEVTFLKCDLQHHLQIAWSAWSCFSLCFE